MNKEIATLVGVSQGTLINMVLTLFFSIGFYIITKFYPLLFPPFFHLKAPLFTWRWWFLIPGVLGFLIVLLFPFVIYKLGAVKVTVLLVASQTLFGVFWDLKMENIPLTHTKVLGIIFCIGSVLLMTYNGKGSGP